MLLLAIERGTENIQPVFCDTGNEHPLTYQYIKYLAECTGLEIKWVKADYTTAIEQKRKTVQTKWREEGISERKIEELEFHFSTWLFARADFLQPECAFVQLN